MSANPVQAAYEGLPDSHRCVLQLARSGSSYAEIADRLGVTPQLVSTWAMHAMLALTRARTAGTLQT